MKTLKCKSTNYGGMRASTKYIVIHYTGNAKDTAKANANYFANNNVGASAHFFVDDNDIYSSVPENYIAWHCETPNMPFKCTCRNRNSIGIELCTCGNYQISDKTAENATELVKELMDKYSIPISNVIRHYDVCGKLCPQPWVKDSTKWQNFKNMLKVNEMTETNVQKICNDMIYKYNKELEDRLITFINNKFEAEREPRYNKLEEIPTYASETITRLVECGILKGDGFNLDLSKDMLRLIVIFDRMLEYVYKNN